MGEEPADALKKEKEFKIHGRVFIQFNDKYTEATFDNDSRPENIFVKNKKNKSYEVGGNLLHRAALVRTLLIRFYLFYEG